MTAPQYIRRICLLSFMGYFCTQDGNGTIEDEELHGFLKDLMELVEEDYDTDDLVECKRILLEKCDLNRDGKINRDELTMVLMSCSKASGNGQDEDVEEGEHRKQ
ncbi:hypothetical protein CHS0354_035070 [Potamilus streckersoni]|uniref:EF-hand domain-containing protein n=1 Tax=Potamilus streckersoni TaxID=2493646 RepID=A0AAE0S7F8_9BIVA|nr:hypothetical protein CHS0354_035070 [Potamilus streckersoni]